MGKIEKVRKFSENHPDVKAIRKYEQEIAALQEKYDKANEEHDWSMRHFCYNQMQAKRANMNLLVEKMRKRLPNSFC